MNPPQNQAGEVVKVKYNYDITIGQEANFLRNESIVKGLVNCRQIQITSEPYEDYQSCERALTELMNRLSYVESTISEKPHVIASKLNPILNDSGSVTADVDAWDKYTIIRAYVADAEALKTSVLRYHVLGEIRIDHLLLGMKSDPRTEEPTAEPPVLYPPADLV